MERFRFISCGLLAHVLDLIALDELIPSALYSRADPERAGAVPLARRHTLAARNDAQARLTGRLGPSPRFRFYLVTFGLHAIAYRRIIKRWLLLPRNLLVRRDG